MFDVSVALGVEEATFESSTSIYPNPAVDKLTIKSKETLSKNTLISVYDGLGKLLRQAVVPVSGLSELSIDVSGLSDGFYVIGITDSHQSIVHKIIKTSN